MPVAFVLWGTIFWGVGERLAHGSREKGMGDLKFHRGGTCLLVGLLRGGGGGGHVRPGVASFHLRGFAIFKCITR